MSDSAATRGRDLPPKPAQDRRADPLDRNQNGSVLEDHRSQSECHHEHHQSHARRNTQQRRQPAHHADICAGRGQQRIAGPRRARRGNRERHERKHVFGGHCLLRAARK